MSESSVLTKKKLVRDYLVNRDIEKLKSWAAKERTPLRVLSSMLFEPDDLIAWRAIEGLGLVSGVVAKDDIEKVRRQIRRLLWLMNDESGGICWNAPEALGEIIFNVPSLIDEFGILLPTYFEEEPFEQGSRWAMSRIGSIKPDIFDHAIPGLTKSLENKDPHIKAFSIMALKSINDNSQDLTIKKLADDNSPVTIYDYSNGELENVTLSKIVGDYLANKNTDR